MPTAKLRVSSVNSGNIVSAIRPESGRELPRTRINVYLDGDTAAVDIDTDDTSAMRAALNSYLECIRITEDINRIIR